MSRLRSQRGAYIRISIILALCSLPGIRSLSISSFGVPPTVPVGESVELNCDYELSPDEAESAIVVKWWWKPLGQPEEQARQLYQRIGKNPPQAVKPDIKVNKNDTISIFSVEPEDSGTYECEVAVLAGGEDRRHQDLLVYTKGTGPQLNASLVEDGDDADEEEDVLVQCAADEVAPQPELAITIDGVLTKIQQWVIESEDGYYNVTANVTASKTAIHDKEIKCELFFSDERISHPAYDVLLTYHVPGEETVTAEAEASTEPIDTIDPTMLPDAATSQIVNPISLFLVILSMFYKYINQL